MKIPRFIVNRIFGSVFAAAADGRLGSWTQAVYWALSGKKRLIGWSGFVLSYAAAAAAGVYCTPLEQAGADILAQSAHLVARCEAVQWFADKLQWAMALLVSVGILDKSWRDPKQPLPDVLQGFLKHAGLIGGGIYAVSAVLVHLLQFPWALEAHTAVTGILLPTLLMTGLAVLPAGGDEEVVKPRPIHGRGPR